MTTAIEKFDPSMLMEGVKQRIKATFVSLIPEDQWEVLCQKQIDEFFEKKERYNNREAYSYFGDICKDVLKEEAKNKVKLYLDKYDSKIWSSSLNGREPNKHLLDLLIKSAPEIFAATFGSMFQRVIQDIRSNPY